MTQDDDVELPGYAPWELPTLRASMPEDLRMVIDARYRAIRVDRQAYDKHTIGAHPESFRYVLDLTGLLAQWS